MSIADRALAAHEADQEAARLRQEAADMETKAHAIDVIQRQAETLFGIEIDASSFERGYSEWTATVPVDDDANLVFTKRDERPNERTVKIDIRVHPCDQLWYDLPPGTEEQPRDGRGRTYACYGLEKFDVRTLPALGAAIVKIREARSKWRAKHCQ